MATVRILRSTTPGNTPSSLVPGQLAINEADGKLFYRASNGAVTLLPTGGAPEVYEYATPANFPATGSAAQLVVATDTGRVYRWMGTAWVELGSVGGGTIESRWDLFLPAAPTGVTASPVNASATVSWTAPTGVIAQAPVTDYVVQFSSNSGSSWSTFSDGTSTATSATVTGLTNGTAYVFRVAGVNAVGTGAYSTASAAVTPSSFTPTSIAGLQLWLDAADSATLFDATSGGSLVAADGGVARWQDKSGNARHATQSTSGSRPLRKAAVQGGRDVLRFDGSNDVIALASDLALSAAQSLFVVFKPTSTITTSSGGSLLSGGAFDGAGTGTSLFGLSFGSTSGAIGNERLLLYVVASDNLGNAQVYGHGQTSSDVSGGTLVSYSFASTGNTFVGRVNGTASFQTVADPGGFSSTQSRRPTVFRRIGSAAADVCELIIYDSALSDSDRQAVENYLMSKWGIT